MPFDVLSNTQNLLTQPPRNMYSDNKHSEDMVLEELSVDGKRTVSRRRSNQCCRLRTCFWVAELIFFLISFFMFLNSFYGVNHQKQCDYADHIPMWSPALDSVKGTGHMHRFDGSFSTPNAFKGTPKPSIDEHWDYVTSANGK